MKDEDSINLNALSVSFMIIPVDMLKGLHDVLEAKYGLEDASKIMFDAGYRCGRDVASKMKLNIMNPTVVSKQLKELWMQLGLGILKVVDLQPNKLIAECFESIEAKTMGNVGRSTCNFTQGYLAGVISTMFNKNFTNYSEDKCISKGDSCCLYTLTAD